MAQAARLIFVFHKQISPPDRLPPVASGVGNQESSDNRGRLGAELRKRGRLPYEERFPHLPVGLCDLEYLACGLVVGQPNAYLTKSGDWPAARDN